MKSLRHLNKYFIKYRYRLLLGVIFVAVNNYFGAEAKLYVGKGTDYVKEMLHQHPLLPGSQADTVLPDLLSHKLFIFGLLIIGLVLLQALFMFFMRQMIIVMSRHIEFDLKNEIFNHYQLLDQDFYKRNNTGDLMNRMSEDVGRVRMYIGPAIMYIANTAGTFFFTIPYMFLINVKLTLIVLSPMPFIVILIWYVSNLINRRSSDVQRQLSAISTFSQETFSGIRVMKAFAREEKINERFEQETRRYRSVYLRLVKTEGAFQPLVLLMVGMSTILAIYYGGNAYIEGKIKLGDIITMIMFITGLIWPIASLGWVTSLIQRAAASQERINEFLSTTPSISGGTRLPDASGGAIEFRNVSLTYADSGTEALKSVSFRIEPGKSMAIVGRTGSGKSTIANLLCRLSDPSSGEIRLGGVNLKDLKLDVYRQKTGYVPQDVFLFSDSIRNNILFGTREDLAGTDEIERAAKTVSIHDGIMEFPKGYETLLGERGITLSGGQKQRISMARAILPDPPILIFDDCLSAVDTETEEEILNNLKGVRSGKISVIISHRISSVQQCDHIIVLENGVVAEEGTHASLLLKQGIYEGMYKQQLLENVRKS